MKITSQKTRRSPAAAEATKGRVPLPDFEPEQARQKRAELRKMRIIATSMLVVAAAIFITCHLLQRTYDWVGLGFIRAAAEAGMVGGLADWFAVTALFRRPLHLPIPHTAIIRNEKDKIGDSLATFVGDNFLNPELVGEKIESAELPQRLGRWLLDEDNAEKVAAELGTAVKGLLEALDDDEVVDLIDRTIEHQFGDRVFAPEMGEYLGKLIDQNKDQPAIQFLMDKMAQWALQSGPVVERIIDRDAPAWAPGFVNYLVGSRITREVIDWTAKVARQPNHEARLAVRKWLREFSEDLQHDQNTIDKVEKLKNSFLEKESTTEATRKTWERLKDALLTTSADPRSIIRRKAHSVVVNVGRRMATNEGTQHAINKQIVAAAKHIAANYAPEITGIISDTVQRWDADEASDKIEVLVGKDLQFIRMNGTIVGALAGLVIYTIAFFILGA